MSRNVVVQRLAADEADGDGARRVGRGGDWIVEHHTEGRA